MICREIVIMSARRCTTYAQIATIGITAFVAHNIATIALWMTDSFSVTPSVERAVAIKPFAAVVQQAARLGFWRDAAPQARWHELPVAGNQALHIPIDFDDPIIVVSERRR